MTSQKRAWTLEELLELIPETEANKRAALKKFMGLVEERQARHRFMRPIRRSAIEPIRHRRVDSIRRRDERNATLASRLLDVWIDTLSPVERSRYEANEAMARQEFASFLRRTHGLAARERLMIMSMI